jgi:hypothetical protein
MVIIDDKPDPSKIYCLRQTYTVNDKIETN